MPPNTAAWLPAHGKPLEVKAAPYTSPQSNEIVIKVGAVAVNPVDWAIQDLGPNLFPWIKYPIIVGSDVAGEVVEVGPGVSRFKVGDRVVGHGLGVRNNPPEAGFQLYTVLKVQMVSPIPSSLSYESASVLPLGLSTAACGLFMKDYLALGYPSVSPKPTGKSLLVWGGATSVGSNAIQLAVAAGYEVITTSSPKNFAYVKSLGASQVFDYNSPTVIADLIAAFANKNLAGAFSSSGIAKGKSIPDAVIANNSVAEACVQIVSKSNGTKFVAMASPVPENLPEGVEAKFIMGDDLKDNEISNIVYGEFLPKALAEGKYVAAPEPMVVGKGLEYVQKAFEVQKNGVSARKVVVSL